MFGPWLPRGIQSGPGVPLEYWAESQHRPSHCGLPVPIGLSNSSVLFGEAHAEFQNFWRRPNIATITGPGFVSTNSAANNRTDLSFGGGIRTIVAENTCVGQRVLRTQRSFSDNGTLPAVSDWRWLPTAREIAWLI